MARNIPQFAPFIGAEEYAAIGECFAHNWITEGPKSTQFVDRLRELIGVRHACLAPNGTLSIFLALRALGIGPGDEVIVPDCTFFGSASAVEMAGATPVFCDINPATLQVEAGLVAPRITPRTRAIMPVHLFGAMCDIGPIIALARHHGLKVVEDAAQVIGVSFNGRHAGTFGDAGCFSFFADKTVTTGEGGLIVTDDDGVADRLLHLRNQGRLARGSFVHPQMGYNFRMTDIQAAIGLVQLGRLGEIVARKHGILARYRERLAGMQQIRFLEVPEGSTQIAFRAVVLAERAHELMRHLEAEGIQARAVFSPLHRQPAFDYLRAGTACAERMHDREFPGAIFAYENGVCLPNYPAMVEADMDYVCETIRAFYA